MHRRLAQTLMLVTCFLSAPLSICFAGTDDIIAGTFFTYGKGQNVYLVTNRDGKVLKARRVRLNAVPAVFTQVIQVRTIPDDFPRLNEITQGEEVTLEVTGARQVLIECAIDNLPRVILVENTGAGERHFRDEEDAGPGCCGLNFIAAFCGGGSH
jgi:hypothetical protein